MSQEINVAMSLRVNKPPLFYQSQAFNFKPDMTGTMGFTPGEVNIANAGTAISLAELSHQGGWCLFQNMSSTDYITIGSYASATFHPLLELLPGESVVVRISRSISTTLYAESAPVAGTSGASAPLLVLAFDA